MSQPSPTLFPPPPAPAPPPALEDMKAPKRKAREPKHFSVDLDENNSLFAISSSALKKGKSINIDTEKIQWDKVVGFESVGGGHPASAGVVIVSPYESHFAVIKGSASVATEVFAAELARELFHLPAPRHRLIEFSPADLSVEEEPEWNEIKTRLRSKAAERSPTLAAKIEKDLNRPFFLLMEFVPGPNLENLLDTKSQESIQAMLESESSFLIDIGCMFVFDILVNNWDRIPGTIWQNEGNASNLIFCETRKRIIPIDQCLTSINTEEGMKSYMERVTSFCQSMKECYSQVHEGKELGDLEPVQSIAKFIEEKTFVEVSTNEKLKMHIYAGLIVGLEKIQKITKEDLNVLKDKVNAMKTGLDWENIWASSVEEIGIQFMDEIIQLIKREYAL